MVKYERPVQVSQGKMAEWGIGEIQVELFQMEEAKLADGA
jgi:hypothetical protein